MPNETCHALDHFPSLAGRLFPDIITVRLGLPVRLYHLSVSGDHQVSVEALAAGAISVGPRGIAQMDSTPEQAGEFAIRHSDDALAGCPRNPWNEGGLFLEAVDLTPGISGGRLVIPAGENRLHAVWVLRCGVSIPISRRAATVRRRRVAKHLGGRDPGSTPGRSTRLADDAVVR